MYFPDRGCVRPSRHLYGYTPLVHALSLSLSLSLSSSLTGAPLNTASSSKHHFPLRSALHSRLTCSVHPCIARIPLVPADSPTLISSQLRLSAHHLALAASASQPLKSGTLSLHLSVPVPVLTPSVVTRFPTDHPTHLIHFSLRLIFDIH